MRKLALHLLVALCCILAIACQDDNSVPDNSDKKEEILEGKTPDDDNNDSSDELNGDQNNGSADGAKDETSDNSTDESKDDSEEGAQDQPSDIPTDVPPIPAEPEDPLPSISYIPAEIIPYEDGLYTAFFYALDDEEYELEAGVMVTWNFGDGSKEETWPASQPPTHQYPTAGDVEYTVTSTFQIGEKNYRGECVVSFDDEGNLKGFDGPDTPADDDNPSQYFRKVADNGNNPLIISKFDNLEMQPAQLRVFLKVTGESPRNEYSNGVFIRKDGAVPRDIQIKGNQGIPAETIVLDFGLKTLDKYNRYSAYSEGQGFGYDDGTKFDIPFYYSASWMTIPANGGTLDLGNVVIWDLQSTGIFGTGEFEHTTWAWKQEASITVPNGYDPQKHYPYVLATIHATFTDEVIYSWKVSNLVFLDR